MRIDDNDFVVLEFFTLKDLRRPRIAEQVLMAFYEIDYEFALTTFDDHGHRLDVDYSNLRPVLDLWGNSENVLLQRPQKYKAELAISMTQAASGFNTLSFWLEVSYFHREHSAEQFLTLCRKIYEIMAPAYGSAHLNSEAIAMATVEDSQYGRTIVPVNLKKGLPDIYWANFFGLPYVDLFTKRKLLLADCDKKVELSDGGFLLVTSKSPLKANRHRQNQLKAFLGEQYFFKWRQTSPSLAPTF